ncbi:8185_t:CDS:2, partial [Funneliformis mosseae]
IKYKSEAELESENVDIKALNHVKRIKYSASDSPYREIRSKN